MGSTTWHPRTSFEKPRQWLLTNGEIVNEPALEQTASGRKVRVAGTDISAFSRDMDDLVLRAVRLHAEQKQTRVWMSLHGQQHGLQAEAEFDPAKTGAAALYVLEKEVRAETIAWWRFRHPTLPIEALLFVRARRERNYYGSIGTNHEVATHLIAPDTQPSSTALSAAFVDETDGNFSEQMGQLEGQAYVTAREFVRDNPPSDWDPLNLLGKRTFGTERLMVEALLQRVRECDELETLQIPDLRDSDNPTWMDLELYETNVSASFIQDMTEYLEGTPSITEALRIYQDLQTCLRSIGLVLEDKTENDFQKGLNGTDPSGVTVQISSPREENGTDDREHALRMHLPTGTFIVDCSVRVNHGAIADKWDEARTIASLTGEEDTLLAFAREVARRDQDKRARKIIRERKGEK